MRRHGRRTSTTLPRALTAALMLLGGHAARASGALETYGPNARARSLANAMVAMDDVAAAHTNPAALARVGRTPMLEVGTGVETPALDVVLDKPRASGDPLAPSAPPTTSGVLGAFLLPVNAVVRDRLVVGAAFYLIPQTLIRARLHDPQRPWFHAYDSATEHVDASVGLGVRITDWLFLGAGARLAGSELGELGLSVDLVRGRITRQTLDAVVVPATPLTAGLLVGPVGVPGILRGSLGVVYREPVTFRVAFPAALQVEGAGIDGQLLVDIATANAPRSLTAGLSLEVLDRLTVNAEVQGAQWSTTPPPFMRVEVDLGGSGLDAVGLADGLDAPAPRQERVVAPGFVDTLAWRLGAELRVVPDLLVVRGGYQFRPSPVPDQSTGTNILDSNAHVFGAGAGIALEVPWLMARPVWFHAAYQAQVLEERQARKASPLDDVGGWTMGGSVHALSASGTFAF